MYAPAARIFLRYVVGIALGTTLGNQLALDPDVVIVTAGAIGIAVEGIYAFAKTKGWKT